jgi:hypothetical protein
VFFCWLALSWYANKKTGSFRDLMEGDGILFIGSLVGAALYWLTRSWLGIGNAAPGTYAAGYNLFNIKKLWDNLQILAGWLIRDYPYLFPLALALLVFKPLRQSKTMFFGVRYALWMGAWAGILLPWDYLSYYLLPFSIGSALFSGTMLSEMLCLLRMGQLPGPGATLAGPKRLVLQRLGLVVFTVLSALLFVPSLVNARAFAVEQLTYDKANWQLVEKAAQLPPNSRLLINLPSQMEYFNEIRLHLNAILNRPDLQIEAYTPGIPPAAGQEIYLASLSINKHFLPQVRMVDEPNVSAWGRCLFELPNLGEKILSSQVKSRIIDIGLHRFFTFFIEPSDMIGNSERDVLLNFVFEYGWNLWKYDPAPTHVPRPAVYNDGVFTYQTESGQYRQVSLDGVTGVPLSGDINGDRFTDLVLYDPAKKTFLVDYNLDGKIDESLPFLALEPGDIPILGDWDGDGKDTPGYFRPGEASWHLFNSFSTNDPIFYQFGMETDIPISGDWNRDGKDELGLYRADSGYTFLVNDMSDLDKSTALNGTPGSIPVVMPREGAGHDTVAYVQGSNWNMGYFPIGCANFNPPIPTLVEYKGTPLAGIWNDAGMK